MEKTNILSADILDILFDGRNKSYGAYDLRKTYDKRIRYAMGGTLLLCLLFILGSLLANGKKKNVQELVGPVIELENIDKEKEKVEPPKEIPKEEPKQEMVKSTIPKIVQDELVKEEDQIQEVEKLEDTKIGTINVEGIKGDDIVAPPVEHKGVVEGPLVKEKDIDELVPTVQYEAQYPGGREAWTKFLERNLNSDIPGENGAPAANYTVTVSFIVDRFGNISDVKAENDPGYGTKAEAVRAILKSQKWIPAMQNGRNVVYRQRQNITFRVQE